jgi:hypothetical protein
MALRPGTRLACLVSPQLFRITAARRISYLALLYDRIEGTFLAVMTGLRVGGVVRLRTTLSSTGTSVDLI